MNIEDVTLDQLYEFMERGNIANAPQKIVDYLTMIEKVRGMLTRIDLYGNRDAVVKHLKLHDKMSDFKANQIINETIQYFYVENAISRDAWRNLYAEKMDKVINYAMRSIKDVSDASKVVKMLLDVSILRQVNEPDKEILPDHFFEKPINLLSLDANIFEFGKANRQGLEDFIDKLPELTEKERIRIKQEAMLLPLKIFPDEHEDARKS